MTRSLQTLIQRLRGFGRPGLFGLACLLAAALLALGPTRGWKAQHEDLQASAERLQRRLVQLPNAASAPATPEDWARGLPEAAQRQQRLADLLELALKSGLVGNRTEHRLSVDGEAGLERLRVNMPVQASYAQLRGFIEAALLQDPALSLDHLKLRRAGPAATEVEAELQWSVHARADRSVSPGGEPRR